MMKKSLNKRLFIQTSKVKRYFYCTFLKLNDEIVPIQSKMTFVSYGKDDFSFNIEAIINNKEKLNNTRLESTIILLIR